MRFTIVAFLTFILATSAMAVGMKDPEAQMDDFLRTLQSAKYDGALENYFDGSFVGQQKPTEIKAMGSQLKAAFEFFGAPRSWELVEIKKIGSDLEKLKLITKHKDEIPLFWSALFYRRLGRWEPMTIFFFDDPLKAGF
jgi:hypothetical protein